MTGLNDGAPGRIRTCDTRFRRSFRVLVAAFHGWSSLVNPLGNQQKAMWWCFGGCGYISGF